MNDLQEAGHTLLLLVTTPAEVAVVHRPTIQGADHLQGVAIVHLAGQVQGVTARQADPALRILPEADLQVVHILHQGVQVALPVDQVLLHQVDQVHQEAADSCYSCG